MSVLHESCSLRMLTKVFVPRLTISVKQAKARGQGRRRSRELEDLHMCASTGKFNIEKLSLAQVEEHDDEHDTLATLPSKPAAKKPLLRRQTDSQLDTKSRGGSLKKTGSKPSANGVTRSPNTAKKPLGRSISGSK